TPAAPAAPAADPDHSVGPAVPQAPPPPRQLEPVRAPGAPPHRPRPQH
ncbi:MAG: hypothetical protein JO276_01285, partial [Sphingomonadaceae bacterium]|nr:hypothetical protein [Sphingomonadaceae bacterium]